MSVRRLLAALVCVATLPVLGAAPADAAVVRQLGKVVHVVDGDTVDVRLSTGATRRVRLLGIDTPEVYNGVQCGGAAASRSLRSMLPVGTRVRLTSDDTQAAKDRYGRLLRYVTKRSTGTDVNRAQVARGWARVYVYDQHPFRRVADYRAAQRAATAAKRGLWGTCTTGGDLASYAPVSRYDCPPNAPIKGNASSMLYHPPSSPWYAITTPEKCFATEAGAEAAGFRHAQY